MSSHLHVVPTDPIPYLDAEREKRIKQISNDIIRNRRLGSFGLKRAMELQEQLVKEISERSPEQVKRMERRLGMHRE